MSVISYPWLQWVSPALAKVLQHRGLLVLVHVLVGQAVPLADGLVSLSLGRVLGLASVDLLASLNEGLVSLPMGRVLSLDAVCLAYHVVLVLVVIDFDGHDQGCRIFFYC